MLKALATDIPEDAGAPLTKVEKKMKNVLLGIVSWFGGRPTLSIFPILFAIHMIELRHYKNMDPVVPPLLLSDTFIIRTLQVMPSSLGRCVSSLTKVLLCAPIRLKWP